MTSKETNAPLQENYINECGVLVIIEGGIIPEVSFIDTKEYMVLTLKQLDSLHIHY